MSGIAIRGAILLPVDMKPGAPAAPNAAAGAPTDFSGVFDRIARPATPGQATASANRRLPADAPTSFRGSNGPKQRLGKADTGAAESDQPGIPPAASGGAVPPPPSPLDVTAWVQAAVAIGTGAIAAPLAPPRVNAADLSVPAVPRAIRTGSTAAAPLAPPRVNTDPSVPAPPGASATGAIAATPIAPPRVKAADPSVPPATGATLAVQPGTASPGSGSVPQLASAKARTPQGGAQSLAPQAPAPAAHAPGFSEVSGRSAPSGAGSQTGGSVAPAAAQSPPGADPTIASGALAAALPPAAGAPNRPAGPTAAPAKATGPRASATASPQAPALIPAGSPQTTSAPAPDASPEKSSRDGKPVPPPVAATAPITQASDPTAALGPVQQVMAAIHAVTKDGIASQASPPPSGTPILAAASASGNGQTAEPAPKTLLNREVTIQLNPEHLGTVSITMRMNAQGVDVRIEVANQQTLHLLNKDRHLLSAAVEAAGAAPEQLVLKSPAAGASGQAPDAAPQQGFSSAPSSSGGGGHQGDDRSTPSTPIRVNRDDDNAPTTRTIPGRLDNSLYL